MITAKELYSDLLCYLWVEDEDFRTEWKDNWDDTTLSDFLSDDYVDGSGDTGWDEVEAILSSWRAESPVIQLDGYTVCVEDHRTGGDEDGTVMWLVLHVKHEDGSEQYFKKDGWYQSHCGGEWEGGFREVIAKPVERIEYLNAV